MLSADFDNSRTRRKRLNDLRQPHLESFKEFLFSTISKSYPDQLAGCARRSRNEIKILIFADNRQIMRNGVPPNHQVIGLFESQLPHVLGGMALRFDEARQRWRQLMVNNEVHAPCSTTWSA